MSWDDLVGLVEQVFDDVVREEGETFIICPECGEPIYEADYRNNGLCPCCEFDFSDV